MAATKRKMRDGIIQRGKRRWAVVLSLGYTTDPTTGKTKRDQRWVSVRGTRRDAVAKRAELLAAFGRGEFVQPTKLTTGQWLAEWLEKVVKPTTRPRTLTTYQYAVASLTDALGAIPLQRLKPADVQKYHGDRAHLAASTLRLHHRVLNAALVSATKQSLVVRNIAPLVEGRRRVETTADEVANRVWSADEARAFLAAAKAAGTQPAAFYALALDTGARLNELCGVTWANVDLDAGSIAIVQQLASPKLSKDGGVQFGPPKTGKSRKIAIGAETVALLRTHRRNQNEVKMKNRAVYKDLGLVFAKEPPDHPLGGPLHSQNLGRGEFARLIAAAKVHSITFHGMRHTTATLLMLAGEPVKNVAARLGHTKASITLDVYGHTLAGGQRQAADRLGALLHG